MAEPKWDPKRQQWILQKQYKKRRNKFYSKYKSAARGKKHCVEQALAWMDQIDQETKSMSEAWEVFMKDYARRHSSTTTYNTNSFCNKHIVKRYPDVPMREMTKAKWQSCIDLAFKDYGLAENSLKRLISNIRIFCRWCAARGMIDDHDVPLYFLIPAGAAPPAEKEALDPDELALLLTCEVENHYIYILRFMVLTGLRRGEACALQRERDYDGISVTVRQSIDAKNIVGPPKTKDSWRRIFLSDLAKEQIEKYPYKKGPMLFPEKYGDNVKPENLS